MKGSLIVIAFAAFLALCITVDSVYTVDTGTSAVVTRNGQVTGEQGPGMHFKIPFIDAVHEMDVRQHAIEIPVDTPTKDMQKALGMISINIGLDPSKTQTVYRAFGENYEDVIVARYAKNAIKQVVAEYGAIDLNTNRNSIIKAMNDELSGPFSSNGIILDSIQVEKLTFGDAFMTLQEQVAEKAAEVRKAEQDLKLREVTAQQQVVDAGANATAIKETADAHKYSTEAEGDATAYAIQKKGEAEATAIKAKSDALNAANGGLVELTKAEAWKNWDGKLPVNILPSTSIPLLNTNALMSK